MKLLLFPVERVDRGGEKNPVSLSFNPLTSRGETGKVGYSLLGYSLLGYLVLDFRGRPLGLVLTAVTAEGSVLFGIFLF